MYVSCKKQVLLGLNSPTQSAEFSNMGKEAGVQWPAQLPLVVMAGTYHRRCPHSLQLGTSFPTPSAQDPLDTNEPAAAEAQDWALRYYGSDYLSRPIAGLFHHVMGKALPDCISNPVSSLYGGSLTKKWLLHQHQGKTTRLKDKNSLELEG